MTATDEKVALITGITGQDGSYLTELLLEKGYAVHGVVRRTSNLLRSRIEHLRRDEKIYEQRLFLHYGDLSDGTTLRRIFAQARPREVYHLAGQSHVGLSFEIPESTCEEIGMATLRLLEIARDQPQPIRFYHASSSEIFGNAAETPQTEEDALAARESVRLRQSFRNAIGANLSAILQLVCLQWNSLQPRISTKRREFCYPQDRASGGANCARTRSRVSAGEFRRPARLGARSRLCPGDVVNAPIRQA